MDTCTRAPKMPMEPASRRDTSYPATFFMTSPPKSSTDPDESSSFAPNTKSRKPPAAIRRGPDNPAATQPPRVDAGTNLGGSKDKHRLRSSGVSPTPGTQG